MDRFGIRAMKDISPTVCFVSRCDRRVGSDTDGSGRTGYWMDPGTWDDMTGHEGGISGRWRCFSTFCVTAWMDNWILHGRHSNGKGEMTFYN